MAAGGTPGGITRNRDKLQRRAKGSDENEGRRLTPRVKSNEDRDTTGMRVIAARNAEGAPNESMAQYDCC
jgi:hypothetical protein